MMGRIFGAILDTLSKAMAIRPTIKRDNLPRMADWTLWGCAISEALGIGQQVFIDAYYKNMAQQHNEVIQADPVAETLVIFMEDKKSWEGTPSELYKKLKDKAEDSHLYEKKSWPRAVNAFSTQLYQMAHNLEESGLRDQASGYGTFVVGRYKYLRRYQ